MANTNDKEGGIIRRLLLTASDLGVRLFRQNVGVGWTGKVARRGDRLLVLENPRPLHAGLCTGSSDVIGWTPIEVTAEMVGRRLAIFTAIEVKTERVRATPEQTAFVKAVALAGGISGVVYSEEEAIEIVKRGPARVLAPSQ